jgi:hypothetical protein
MKTTTLLIAAGLVSSAALAQAQSAPGSTGAQTGVQTDSRAGDQSQYSIGPSGTQAGSGASGPQAGSAAGVQPPSSTGTLSPQSGPHSGMPPHPASGTSGTLSGSQSGMPPGGPDASGAQPAVGPGANAESQPTPQPTLPSSGASGTQPATQSGMPPSSTSGTSGTQAEMPPLPGAQSDMQAQPASGASGTQATAQPQGGPDISPIARLQPKTENGVTYICGGVGKEEATYMKREARKHDALLTFADKRGEFVADVNVAIKDPGGKTLLETKCDGPMMLVDLPKGGKYRIHAEVNGHPIEQTVAVAKGPGKKSQQVAEVFLTWPTRVAAAEGTAETATGSSGTSGTGASGGKSKAK